MDNVPLGNLTTHTLLFNDMITINMQYTGYPHPELGIKIKLKEKGKKGKKKEVEEKSHFMENEDQEDVCSMFNLY